MGPLSYMQSVLDRNVIMRCMTVQIYIKLLLNLQISSLVMVVETDSASTEKVLEKQILLKESLCWWVPETVMTLRRIGMFLALARNKTTI